MPSTHTSNHEFVKAALENSRASRTRENRTPDRSERTTDIQSQVTSLNDTPLRASTHALQTPPTIAKMKPALEAELSGGVRDIAPPNDTIYRSFDDDRIAKFIEDCALYDNETKTWKQVREAEQKTTEKYLYTPLKHIIHEVLQFFEGPKGESRWVSDTHAVRMSHIEGDKIYEEVSPEGGKKEWEALPTRGAQIPTLSLPVEVKQTTFNPMTVLLQAGIYARQCFIHQPFRRYVPVVVIAGSNLYLHIYDRAGVLRSDAINIHQDPTTFVRIILGASTVGTDPQFSPFDPQVRWRINNEHPTIAVKNKGLKHNIKYKTTGTKFSRKAIRGRGTYCVDAQAKFGGKVVAVLIKDAWRSYTRAAEWELLNKIKGLDGVGQILAYDENECGINAFRQHIMDTYRDDGPPEARCERVFSRLVLQAYGRSIRYFSSRLQLLEALYDAVAGHKNLWKAGILHRDVSIDNILLGVEGAAVGNRGVLIDFDMAIDVHRTQPDPQFRTGTRAFQSVAVLRSGNWGVAAPPQDHLDDLESFLYVLGWMCIKYDGTGTSRSPEFLNNWEHSDAKTCANFKRGFLEEPTEQLTDYFNTPIFRTLLISLGKLCDQRYRVKVTDVTGGKTFPVLSKVHEATQEGQEHDEFLAIIQEAIVAQKSVHEVDRRLVPTDDQTRTNVEFAESNNPPPAASSNPTGTKRSNPASEGEGEAASGSLPKRPKVSGTRRSARLNEKK